MSTPVERFLHHLDELSGGVEPRFHQVESTRPGLGGVTSIVYEQLPDDLLTGFTYGLSRAEHPDWRHGRPELCISVRSTDLAWPLAVAQLAERLRGECPFSYGNTIRFGDQVSPESGMTAFLVFAPAVLGREDYLGIDVGEPLPVNIAGVYPVHESERRFVEEHGLDAFWQLDWDMYDVTRPPVV